MTPLTFVDTHNMVVFLSKSNASAGFDQIVDFLNAQVIQYALMINPTIYVSCIKQLWATTSIKKDNDVVKLQALIDGKNVVVTKDVIRQDLYFDDADGVEEGKGFSGVETPLFASMMVQPQPQAAKVVKRVKVPNVPTPPSHTTAPSPPLQDPTPIPHATPHASPPSPPQEQPTITSESSMSPLNTLMETCATLSQKVAELEYDKQS
nr:hypothetical protein [Tanacetum cinerariifolium]